MNLLVVSTVPHYISIVPIYKYYSTDKFIQNYINIIAFSTSLSIVYHIYNESNIFITSIDYYMAFVWFLYDLMAGFKTNRITRIFVVNYIIFCINICIPYDTNYVIVHSGWHILSSLKCYYVSRLLADKISKQELPTII